MMVQGIIIFKTKPSKLIGGQQMGSDGSGEYTWVYEGINVETVQERFDTDYKYLKESKNHIIIYSVLNYDDYYGNSIIKIRT